MDHEKILVVMPAYNAAKTLQLTYEALPQDKVDAVILVDDGSTDDTIEIAKGLNLKVFAHVQNFGYGANQKTCYLEALRAGASIVVMVHPDYQYDPSLLPQLVEPVQKGEADVVFGSRMIGISARKQGMPWWKFLANKFLTSLENWVFGLNLSEYHTGYRAYRRSVLEQVNFLSNSDGFIFDQEIVAQFVEMGCRIAEVPVPVRYFPDASSASLIDSIVYGFKILLLLVRYVVYRKQWIMDIRFSSPSRRYVHVPTS